MDSSSSPLPRSIRRLMDAHDLVGLIQWLRQPRSPELRAQAAQALGGLQDLEAVESLARSTLEDPDPAVQAAARRALRQLLGARAELALDSYRQSVSTGTWLLPETAVELPGEEPSGQISETDLDGLILVARHEPNLDLRLKAIRRLAQTSDMRATSTLAELALWGQPARLRQAARSAIESRYGEDAAALLEQFVGEEAGEEDDDPFAEDEEISEGPLDPELRESQPEDLDEELDEDDWDDDADDELSAEDQDEETDLRELFPMGEKVPPPSPYSSAIEDRPAIHPVVEEVRFRWQTVLGILVIVLILGIILILLRP